MSCRKRSLAELLFVEEADRELILDEESCSECSGLRDSLAYVSDAIRLIESEKRSLVDREMDARNRIFMQELMLYRQFIW